MHKYLVGITSGVLTACLTGYILVDTFVISKEQTEEIPTQDTTAYQVKTEKQVTTSSEDKQEDQTSDTDKKEKAKTEETFEPKTYNSEFGGELKDDKQTDTANEDDYAYGYGRGNTQSNQNESGNKPDNWFDRYFENYKEEYSNDDFSADWEEWFQKEFRSGNDGWNFYYESDNFR